MCGIAGVFLMGSERKDKTLLEHIHESVISLKHRGPDFSDVRKFDNAALAHARLSIIDTSVSSNQPFSDESGRYHIVFNGEIFNFRELRYELQNAGVQFNTDGDVEVLLQLFLKYRSDCLNKLKGFFAFGLYDKIEHTLFLARDRFGVKPLYFFCNKDVFCFGSEVSAIVPLMEDRKLDFASLDTYFRLNYIAGDSSVFESVKKLKPGTYMKVSLNGISEEIYFKLGENKAVHADHSAVENKLRTLLTESVRQRLIADVPVGCFLSGGIDSTIITALASGMSPNISTFCLGFKDNKFFDESQYAELAAKKFNTDHHTFSLSNDDLFSDLFNFLDALDEPFADSSALNVFILSKRTKPYVKTVLSGDGADEVFGGYNKHRAEWLVESSFLHKTTARLARPVSKLFPSSRNSSFSNKIRQLGKFAEIIKLPLNERYWRMASISTDKQVELLMKAGTDKEFAGRKAQLLSDLDEKNSFASFLYTDVKMVLEGDMLVKADRMSMANGLEIRSPFMDFELIEFGLSLSAEEKINSKEGKIILKRTFSDLIPAELLHRKKHGFEVPLYSWMTKELKSLIDNDYLSKNYILDQGIFNYDEVLKMKQQLFSSDPGDAPARVWALFVFNYWYRKNIQN